MGIHPDIIDRYVAIIRAEGVTYPLCNPDPGTSLGHLLWMLEELRTLEPDDKAGRWLGFVQGCLTMRKLVSVTTERDFTRPYFAPRMDT